MTDVTVKAPSNSDLQLVKLAREIAMDIHPLDTILKQYSISAETWEILQQNSRFQSLLASEVETWHSAMNTSERVKAKAAAMLEEWLPELNNRLHDPDMALPAKIEGGKLITKLAGMDGRVDLVGAAGERFSVVINLGADAAPIRIEKDVAPVVIDHEASQG
ncbi:MAG: hypothetical protein KGL39_54150 [Patescibacteria group bacterium]|nr:hypothetical protein [Patescibacteria group bacterium]